MFRTRRQVVGAGRVAILMIATDTQLNDLICASQGRGKLGGDSS